MAHSSQARKRVRSSQRRRRHNASQRSLFRTVIKRVLAAIEAADREAAMAAYAEAVPVIDRAAGKNLIHRNKAARHKSRLNARILAMGGGAGDAKPAKKAKSAEPAAETETATKTEATETPETTEET